MRRSLLALLAVTLCALLFVGCPSEAPEEAATEEAAPAAEPPPPPAPRVAVATLQFKADYPGASGSVTFTETTEGVQVSAKVSYGGEGHAGKHGFHVHETGDCSAEDFTSTGGHFNPTGVDHGGPDAEVHHAGDFGNIEIGEDGVGKLELTASENAFGGVPFDQLMGKGVILHAGEDDLTSQPTGAAGARDACGVIIQQS